jgi:hypothetical protein
MASVDSLRDTAEPGSASVRVRHNPRGITRHGSGTIPTCKLGIPKPP